MTPLSQIRWIEFTDNKDERGRLTAVEALIQIPFSIQRVFYIHQVKEGLERGGHAHRDTDQVAVAVHGSLKIDASDGIDKTTLVLDQPNVGLYLPHGWWLRLYDFDPGAVCLVLASTQYDRTKSIRTWEDYLNYRGLMVPIPSNSSKTPGQWSKE
jgi:hypothetical protein